MTGRLADIAQRIASVRELDSVIAAMRGIAASRAQLCRARLPGVLAYEEVIADAIVEALPLVPRAATGADRRRGAGHAVVLFGAEQGFAGAFTDRVLDGAATVLKDAALMLLGTRAATVVEERGLPVAWGSAMPSHPDAVATTADRVAEALYERIVDGRADRVSLVFPVWQADGQLRVETRALLPFDFGHFVARGGMPPRARPPLLTLPAATLLARLVEEYVFAELCAAALEAIAAENEARIAAMLAANRNVERVSSELHALERRTRQNDITAEIAELSTGLMNAGRDGPLPPASRDF